MANEDGTTELLGRALEALDAGHRIAAGDFFAALATALHQGAALPPFRPIGYAVQLSLAAPMPRFLGGHGSGFGYAWGPLTSALVRTRPVAEHLQQNLGGHVVALRALAVPGPESGGAE